MAAAMAAAVACAGTAQGTELAGTTLRDRSGWSASLFVSPPPDKHSFTEPSPEIVVPPVVNATIARRIAKNLSLKLDMTNVFDRRLPSDNYLFQPAQPRGLLLHFNFRF